MLFCKTRFFWTEIMCHQYGGHCDVTVSEPKIAGESSARLAFVSAHQQWRSQSCRANYLLPGKSTSPLWVTRLRGKNSWEICLILRTRKMCVFRNIFKMADKISPIKLQWMSDWVIIITLSFSPFKFFTWRSLILKVIKCIHNLDQNKYWKW